MDMDGPAEGTTVLHVSDMHFEDETVFGDNYDTEQEYREHAHDMLEELSEDADIGWFSGDCGTGQDREELDAFMDRFDDSVMIGGNSDEGLEFYEPEDGSDEPDRAVFDNMAVDGLDIPGGPTYTVLRSHIPQQAGVRPGNDPERSQYLRPADHDKAGTMEAADDAYDIVVTAHYHGEGSFTMEDGTLVLQAGSTADNYITGEDLPETSAQRITFVGDEVQVEHIDFATGEVVEERGYRSVEDGFVEEYREPSVLAAQRYEGS